MTAQPISAQLIADLLQPYVVHLAPPPEGWSYLYDRLGTYLHLLLKWNGRMNLTAIRDPEAIVRRHFGESLFAAGHIGVCRTLLDFGSGAGFPGVPIALVRPELRITLAESQARKASFLREVCRELAIPASVHADRVEKMPPENLFDVVALRAVDNMPKAVQEAAKRARIRLLWLTTVDAGLGGSVEGFAKSADFKVPNSDAAALCVYEREQCST